MADYDTPTKFLIEHYPADFLRLAGLPVDRRAVRVVDANLASIASSADKLIRVGTGRRAYVVNLEVQVRRDVDLDDRMHYYHAAARRRHRVPVRSVVLALRPAACPPAVTGRVFDPGDGHTRLDFRYHLIRAYALPPAATLTGGIGVVPFAGLAAVGRGELLDVLREVRRRLDAEVPPAAAEELWTSTGILMGVRYTAPVAAALISKVKTMRESSVYQMILTEGRAEGLTAGRAEGEQRVLLQLASARFGPADPPTAARVRAVTDPEELERLGGRLLAAGTWDEWLDG